MIDYLLHKIFPAQNLSRCSPLRGIYPSWYIIQSPPQYCYFTFPYVWVMWHFTILQPIPASSVSTHSSYRYTLGNGKNVLHMEEFISGIMPDHPPLPPPSFQSTLALSNVLLTLCSLLTAHFYRLIGHASLLSLVVICITHKNNGPKILQNPPQDFLTFWISDQGKMTKWWRDEILKSDTKSYMILRCLL